MKIRPYLIGIIILLLAITGAMMTACGGESPLVGKWVHTEGISYIEFFKNGEFVIGTQIEPFKGTYKVTGGNEVTLTVSGADFEADDEDYQLAFEYSIEGNKLTLSDGETPVYFIREE